MTALWVGVAIGVVIAIIITVQRETSAPNPKIVCQFCHKQGGVRVIARRRKAGISGGKATGALLTGGLSMLGTGLSRKVRVLEMNCTNCRMKWDVS